MRVDGSWWKCGRNVLEHGYHCGAIAMASRVGQCVDLDKRARQSSVKFEQDTIRWPQRFACRPFAQSDKKVHELVKRAVT